MLFFFNFPVICTTGVHRRKSKRGQIHTAIIEYVKRFSEVCRFFLSNSRDCKVRWGANTIEHASKMELYTILLLLNTQTDFSIDFEIFMQF